MNTVLRALEATRILRDRTKTVPYKAIAEVLNVLRYMSPTGETWTSKTLRSAHLSIGIHSMKANPAYKQQAD